MKDLNEPPFTGWRIHTEWEREQLGDPTPKQTRNNGVFVVPCGYVTLRVIVGVGSGWDHISVSVASRCPTWAEMDFIKRKFFHPNEVAYQLHVPESDHINVHPYVLHIWRKHGFKMPLPPKEFV